MKPASPAIQTSFAAAAHTHATLVVIAPLPPASLVAASVALEPLVPASARAAPLPLEMVIVRHAVPSQCITMPASPTTQASFGPVPLTELSGAVVLVVVVDHAVPSKCSSLPRIAGHPDVGGARPPNPLQVGRAVGR